MKNILVIGGAGYCGSILVPQLLDEGHKVTVFDIMWYGNEFLPHDNSNLTLVQGDVREVAKVAEACEGQDTVLHLACISNDASFDLDEALSTLILCIATHRQTELCSSILGSLWWATALYII